MLGNRIKETTSDNFGTGNVTTLAVATNYQSFNTVFGTNRRLYYTIIDSTANLWETGQGYLSASTTLVRQNIFDNSSGTKAAINFANTNEKTIICSGSSYALAQGFSGYVGSTSSNYGVTSIHNNGQANQTYSVSANTLYILPWIAPLSMDCDGVGYYHLTNSTGSGDRYQFGLYDVASDGTPGNLLRTTGDVDLSTGAGTPSTTSWSAGNIEVCAGESYYIVLGVGGLGINFKGLAANQCGSNHLGVELSAGNYRWSIQATDTLSGGWTSLPASPSVSTTANTQSTSLMLLLTGSV